MLKRNKISLIILFIATAVFGLIAVQIYWIDNAITLGEEKFKEDVNAALSRSVESMERNEALGYIKNSALGTRFFQDYATQYPNNISEKITRRDTVLLEGDKKIKMQIIDKERIDSISGFRTEERLFSHIMENGINKETGEASVNIHLNDSIQLYFRPENFGSEIELGKKAKMVEEILSDMFSFHGFVPADKRINVRELDSILKMELKNRMIDAPFRFVLSGIDHHPVLFKDEASKKNAEKIMQSGYGINIFPGDFLNEPLFLFIDFPSQRSYLLGRMWTVLSLSGLLMLVVIIGFYITIATILRQKKLSEIKNDFISNMTHELKTPISTIALASEVLNDTDISLSDDKRKNYIQMIRDENKRLGVLVENVLQTAVLERGEVKLKTEQIHVNDLLSDLLNNFEIQVKNKLGELHFEPLAENDLITGDRVHLTNVFYNLLDNANKYSPNRPEIAVKTENRNDKLYVKVADNGIGISKENQKKIFDYLYRVPSGNIHTVKGFGLGLSYVKAIVEKHNGQVYVNSETGRGSEFIIEIPQQHG